MSHHPVATNQERQIGGAETVGFVSAHLKPGATILDVGCGDGTLAKLLIDNGFKVTGVDRNEEAIEKAKALGVPAVAADFLQYQSPSTFDALLFSRSLHHIHPIESAVDHALKLLKDGGLLMLEDFGAELMDAPSAIWFYGLKSLLACATDNAKSHGPKLDDGQIPSDPVQSWRDHHFKNHDVIESGIMLPVLEKKFELVHRASVPYLYRYFLDDISSEQAQRLLKWEEQLCKARAIATIGIRFVGKKNSTS
ncbi:MAG TPA: class I SAM-dependent methyltransferase [Candidatus Obscuribacterales bacterium]